MTPALAHFLAGLTIMASGALLASVLVSFLPARRRTIWAMLAIVCGAVGSVAFGAGIGRSLPDRIVATHEAQDTLARVHETLPELDQLEEAEPLIVYELEAAFHDAFLAGTGSATVRAERAGHAMGLAIQRAHLRHLSGLPDLSARRLIAIERQIVEEEARIDPMRCSMAIALADRPSAPPSPRLLELRRAELRAKLGAVVDRQEDLPTFDIVERRHFEVGLKALADLRKDGPALAPDAPCRAQRDFYTALEQQPLSLQGRWVRSRRIYGSRG